VAHRVYLYNVNKIGKGKGACLEMVEWNYQFPTILSPLLSATPVLERNRFNDTGKADGIYAEAKSGKALMVSLYAFLERHAHTLVSDPEAFHHAKRRILAFLANRATHRYFHLQGWDVFNLSEAAHDVQAADWLARIEHDNAWIRQAIDRDDPSLLDQCAGLALEEVGSFRELINQSHYDYGWEPLTSAIYDDTVTFSKKGLKGLMSVTGEVLLPAAYDDIGEFHYSSGIAVVKQGDRYGYISQEGHEVTPVCFDEALSFEDFHGYGRVAEQGRYGVIDTNGRYVLPCRYDKVGDFRWIRGSWAVQEQGLWGIIEAPGTSWTLLSYRPGTSLRRPAAVGHHGFEQIRSS
jgi:hypothetical protein